MTVREAVLNDPEVARLLRDHFVCIAIDNTDHPQLTPGERAFVLDRGLKGCTWGMSIFTAGGGVLEMGGTFEAKGVAQMLQRALDAYTPEENVDVPEPTAKERGKLLQPPKGGLLSLVTWKVLGDFRPDSTLADLDTANRYRHAIGMDRLWVRQDEAQSLARGEFPPSLKKRMLWHFNYAVAGDVTSLELTLQGGQVTGSFRTDRGDAGDVLGFVQTKDGRVTRFDLLVKGLAEQHFDFGFSASLEVIPKGTKLPVAVLFTLLDPADGLAHVVPSRAGSEDYLE